MDEVILRLIFYTLAISRVVVLSQKQDNVTLEPADRQLLDYKLAHPKPIGVLTTSAGAPVDIRDTIVLNTDSLANQYHLDLITHFDAERIPERTIFAKGNGAFGYFEVTHDVSQYTKADVFNGVGKKTPVGVRFSVGAANLGGTDLSREHKGMSVKFYTEKGNLDFVCIQIPIFTSNNPISWPFTVRAFKRNPRTNLYDNTARWDIIVKYPELLTTYLWILSDYGLPNGYRNMDAYPVHTYEIYNKKGDIYYVRFNFRNEQGSANLTTAEAMAISGVDPDYFGRDLYNAIGNKKYPFWKLEMDVLSSKEILEVDYNPFDLTGLWKAGTYKSVPIGRLVLDKNPTNHFKDVEMAAFNPGNLVPGISAPLDEVFKVRRLSYRGAQNYRLGINHNKIDVNNPKYVLNYNRDGVPPVKANMKDAPNYYPNSFNGPVPFVDEDRPKKRVIVFYRNAADLEQSAYFYNHIVDDDAHRQRIANNMVLTLTNVAAPVLKEALRIIALTDNDLYKRVSEGLTAAKVI